MNFYSFLRGSILPAALMVMVPLPLNAQPDTDQTISPNLVNANNAFALDLFHRLDTAPADNVFFSPYSISTALALTWAGAQGATAGQMAKALQLDNLPPTQVTLAFGSLQKGLNAMASKGDIRLAVANSLWPQQDHAFLPEYLKLAQNDFSSGVFAVDYKTQAEAARLRINAWVADQTNQRIKDLLHAGDVTATTRLVLTNAIYFKGKWATLFDAKQTKPAPFTLTSGTTQTVALMHKKVDARFVELADDPVPMQIIALPYQGSSLEFIALLPKSPAALPALEKELSSAQLATWLNSLPPYPREIEVFLPKFKLTQRFGLSSVLQSMGMTDAFDPTRADFSGMDGARDLSIGNVIHQAFVEVNEEGTEAAAATGVIMVAMAAIQPTTFRADHPFLFLIRDSGTGSILFLGRLATPPTEN